MRLWIAVFLLTLFAFQAMPVVAFGKLLAKTQCAKIQKESVADDDDAPGNDDDSPDGGAEGAKTKKAAAFEDAYLHITPSVLAGASECGAARIIFLHKAAHIRALHTGEVTTPPPDCR